MAFKDQLVGRLKFSIVSTGKYVLPYFLTDFLRVNPGVEISIDVTNREKVLVSQLENEVDFSLVSDALENPTFNSIDILTNDLYLVGNNETAKLQPTFNYLEFKNELVIEPATSAVQYFLNLYLNPIWKIKLLINYI